MALETPTRADGKIDTDRLKMPGGLMNGTVATADDKALQTELNASVESTRQLLERVGLEPDTKGMPPDGFDKTMGRDSNDPIVVERNTRRVRAIRQELGERAEARRKQRKAEQSDAQKRLKRLVDDGPDMMAKVRDKQAAGAEAMVRMRQFINDVHAVAAAFYARNDAERLERGVYRAADAIDVDTPDLASEPEGAPGRRDLDDMLTVIRGMQGGFNIDRPVIGDASKAEELSSKL